MITSYIMTKYYDVLWCMYSRFRIDYHFFSKQKVLQKKSNRTSTEFFRKVCSQRPDNLGEVLCWWSFWQKHGGILVVFLFEYPPWNQHSQWKSLSFLLDTIRMVDISIAMLVYRSIYFISFFPQSLVKSWNMMIHSSFMQKTRKAVVFKKTQIGRGSIILELRPNRQPATCEKKRKPVAFMTAFLRV